MSDLDDMKCTRCRRHCPAGAAVQYAGSASIDGHEQRLCSECARAHDREYEARLEKEVS